jgi:hypothetical protein
MASKFPEEVDQFTTKVDQDLANGIEGDDVEASHINDLQNAVIAIEEAIGTTTSTSSIEERLSAVEQNTVTTYIFTQSVPATTWTIDHNLGRFPSVTIVDSAGTQVFGDVQYTSNTQVVLTFSAVFLNSPLVPLSAAIAVRSGSKVIS